MIKKKYRNSFFLYETRDDQSLYLNINTTPLIDVLLVLIIMIIITMPIQLNKLDLNLSQGQEGSKIRETSSSYQHKKRRHGILKR